MEIESLARKEHLSLWIWPLQADKQDLANDQQSNFLSFISNTYLPEWCHAFAQLTSCPATMHIACPVYDYVLAKSAKSLSHMLTCVAHHVSVAGKFLPQCHCAHQLLGIESGSRPSASSTPYRPYTPMPCSEKEGATEVTLRVAYFLPNNLKEFVGPVGVWGDVEDILHENMSKMKVKPRSFVRISWW